MSFFLKRKEKNRCCFNNVCQDGTVASQAETSALTLIELAALAWCFPHVKLAIGEQADYLSLRSTQLHPADIHIV